MRVMSSARVTLCEYVTSGAIKVDRGAGTIRDVKILGLQSANGYRYLPEAIERARGLYEGAQVNLDHPAKPTDPRSVTHRFGWLSDIERRADGLYGTLNFLKSHSASPAVLEAAERNPSLFGLSHVATGNRRKDKDGDAIDSIESVHSVDLVSNPATVKGLFESINMATTTVREVLRAAFPDAIKLLREQDYPMATEMPAPEAGMDSMAQAHEAFKQMIMAVLDDTKLDMKMVLQKIKDILKAKEKLMGGGETSSSDAPEEGSDMAAEESKKQQQSPTLQEQVNVMQAELGAFRRQTHVRALCDQDGYVPTATQLKALVGLKEDVEIKELIGELKGAGGNSFRSSGGGIRTTGSGKGTGLTVIKAKSAPPGTQAVVTEQKLPTTVQELKAFILN